MDIVQPRHSSALTIRIGAFLAEVKADRGERISDVCKRVISELPQSAQFDPGEVLQIALERLDAEAVARGDVYLSGLRRCDS